MMKNEISVRRRRMGSAALLIAGMASIIALTPAQSQAPAAPAASATPAPGPVPAGAYNIARAEEILGDDSWRSAKFAQSSRKHQIVNITAKDGRKLEALIVSPDTTEKVPVIVMIPEDQGLNRWGREIADQIAAMGYIVVAPDFMYGLGPNGGGGLSFPDYVSVFTASMGRVKDDARNTSDLNQWADLGLKLPQSNGKLATVGFAWGGGRAFWFATQRKDLKGAFIFYDAAPPPEALAGLTAPVYAFYAEHDPRVTRSLDATKAAMTKLGKKYEPVMYPGSEHMFVRLGNEARDTNPANILARHQAMARLQELLAKL